MGTFRWVGERPPPSYEEALASQLPRYERLLRQATLLYLLVLGIVVVLFSLAVGSFWFEYLPRSLYSGPVTALFETAWGRTHLVQKLISDFSRIPHPNLLLALSLVLLPVAFLIEIFVHMIRIHRLSLRTDTCEITDPEVLSSWVRTNEVTLSKLEYLVVGIRYKLVIAVIPTVTSSYLIALIRGYGLGLSVLHTSVQIGAIHVVAVLFVTLGVGFVIWRSLIIIRDARNLGGESGGERFLQALRRANRTTPGGIFGVISTTVLWVNLGFVVVSGLAIQVVSNLPV